MFEEGDTNSNSSDSDKESKVEQITIEVDGESKSFSPDNIQNLVSQQASATQKTQQVSAVLKACNKFDMNPEVFVGQAEDTYMEPYLGRKGLKKNK